MMRLPSRRKTGPSVPVGTRTLSIAAAALMAAFLAGCGGNTQDYSGFNRSLGGDISNGYNTSISSRGVAGVAGVSRGTYPMLETSFALSSLPGDPFDYEKVNVRVELRKPDGGTASVPAFFDGGNTWKMRYTPTAPGQYAVISVKLNRETAHEENLSKKEWSVSGEPTAGFVRIDHGDHSRFVFDNGQRYFPLGHNQAWHSKDLPEIPEIFGKMHAAGENWSRVWMTSWDGKNLDWPLPKSGKLGDINLEVAKKWDSIVESAGKNDIYFQLCLQHHGQYSANVDPNWNENPYNAKNGGFLRSPNDFFTDPKARALTKRKLYYVLSRWGYSPNLLAFELFNEVENTDAFRDKRYDDVAMWHREMSLFIRQFDGYRHLITTSSAIGVPLTNPVWDTVDYIQEHIYPVDIVTAISNRDNQAKRKVDKPYFIGEFGPRDLKDSEGIGLHNGLWASLTSGMSGAAEYWDWEAVDRQDLYHEFRSAQGFLTASALPNQGGLATVALPVDTAQRASLRFSPGGGWASSTNNEFIVGTSGVPAGIDRYPSYLQGQGHRAMMPKPLTFQVSYLQPGSFSVSLNQIAAAGAHLKVAMDGKAVEREFPGAKSDYTPKTDEATITVDVPQGAHTLTVENTGKDWAVLGPLSFSNYAPALAANARFSKEYLVAWVYHRDNVDAPTNGRLKPAVTGKITVPGLKPGKYHAVWWDTHAGHSESDQELTITSEKSAVTLTTPSITRDMALFIAREGSEPTGKRGGKAARTVTTSVITPTRSDTTNVPAESYDRAGVKP